MDDSLKHSLYKRLRDHGGLTEEWSTLVIAACEGSDELAQTLDAAAAIPISETALPKPSQPSRGTFLASITAQGFRGIGSEVTLELEPGPGITLVVGRNGSGKSSFAESLEVLLTGDSKRWSDRRQAAWKEGWRKLHKDHPCFVAAGFLIEGSSGEISAERKWDVGAALEEGTATFRRSGAKEQPLVDLEWSDRLTTFRPFLSYNELGSMLEEGPSKLYDALSLVLGLDDLVAAQNLLDSERSARDKALRETKARLKTLIPDLEKFAAETGDPRAQQAVAALSSKEWNLASVEAAVSGEGQPEGSELEILESLASLPALNTADVEASIAALQRGAAAVKAVAGTDTDKARILVGILAEALDFHSSHGEDDCPVCGQSGALGGDWAERTSAAMMRLEDQAHEAEAAHAALESALQRARRLLSPPPDLLNRAPAVGIPTEDLQSAWAHWAAPASGEPLALAAHLETNMSLLSASLDEVRKRARVEREAREDAWKPLAQELSAWLGPAREAVARAERVQSLKSAHAWLKRAHDDIRNERFEPIAQQAIAIWDLLKQQSNVSLGRVELTGMRTKRRVEFEVTVDGVPGVALGVMSQGELHSLALSLFLPRVMLPESPFRFVVIDDPVQSMDPARVDGLARVLQDVAETRQVVVFTHDDRLPEAVRRLRIPARIIQVTRRLHSTVELKTVSDPVSAAIEEALAMAHTRELPQTVASRVVPGFCRSALEAAFIEAYRRERLGRGDDRDEVEAALDEVGKLTEFAALALFGSKERGGDVMSRINKWGTWAGDTFKDCNRGSHKVYGGSLVNLCESTRKLADKILTMT